MTPEKCINMFKFARKVLVMTHDTIDLQGSRAVLEGHLKMDGWSTIVSFWDGLFFGVFGSVIPRNYLHANLTVKKFIEFTAGCGLVFFTEFLLGVLANLALTSSVLVAVRNLSSTYSLTRALQSLLLGTQF